MGTDYPLSFREVIPDQTQPSGSHRKEITLNTGASQSTLQDIKVAERAGGFCYAGTDSVHTRNRFIHWRTSHDCLELLEISLDANLSDNHVRYRFADAPVLSVAVHEALHSQQLVLLVVTVSSIHRLPFSHPDLLARRAQQSGNAADANLSIFHEASMQTTRDPQTYHVIGQANGSSGGSGSAACQIPHTAAAWLEEPSGDGLYALAYQHVLLLFRMNANGGQTVVSELKQHTIVPRIFSNITGALRGKSNTNDSQYAVSLVFDRSASHTFLYALYRDDHVRMWSVRSGQCVATVNCVPDTLNGETRPQGPQQNILRRCTHGSLAAGVAQPSICAFLSHSHGSEFVTIRTGVAQPANSSSEPARGDVSPRFQMQRVACIPAPPNDLVDFELDELRLWALWCNSLGDFIVASYALLPGRGSSLPASLCWQSAALEPPIEPPVPATYLADPRETYCSHIFFPGRFQRDTIAKALLMYARAANAGSNATGGGGAIAAAAAAADTAALSLAMLKERVCVAIEGEISAELLSYECEAVAGELLSDEDMAELCAAQWERFYMCAEQYHLKTCQPIGLFGLARLGGVCIVRKGNISLLRPCELLEHLLMQSDDTNGASVAGAAPTGGSATSGRGALRAPNMDALDFHGETEAHVQAVRDQLQVDAPAAGDLVRLVRVLAAIEVQLGDDLKRDIHERLYQLHMPNVIVADLLTSADLEETVFTREFLLGVQQEIQAIGDLRTAMNLLLETLRLDDADGARPSDHSGPRALLGLGALFGGDLGVSTLAESLKQLALVRYALCRNLLILQQLLIDRWALGCDVLEEVRSNCQPNTVVFVQAYYVMVWLCEIPVQSGYAAASLEHNMQRLNVLQISAASRRIIRPAQPITLLEFFLRSRGLQAGWATFAMSGKRTDAANGSQEWSDTMLPLLTGLGQLIWSVSGSFTFGEWLIGSCQHVVIQEYVRLLNSWCEWNSCSRHFIAAVTMLETGEPAKAFDLFMQSAKGVLTEPFLEQCIVPQDQTCSDNEAMTAYYLKVIQLFEQHGCLDRVIALAKTAIGILEGDDPQLAMFQSIVFTNHLALEHYDEAYHALIDNAEPARRKDCLRQLVVRLFEQQRLDLLMRFPYVRLQDELEEIVETRARATPVQQNRYYEFLFAFHVTKGNMRRAAAIQYEQAMRCMHSDGTSDDPIGHDAQAVHSRYECLLGCLNALKLSDERYAWLARPVSAGSGGFGGSADEQRMDTSDTDGNEDELDSAADYDQDEDDVRPPTRVQVLEIEDIERELCVCEAQLQLLQLRNDLRSAVVHADPEQLVAVLASCGLYTAAIKLAQNGLRKRTAGRQLVASVLEHLASACVRSDEESADETWTWLKENDLADVPHRNQASEMAWKLLQRCVNENEQADETRLHRAVAEKLMTIGVYLPEWLHRSYQEQRPAELLLLYVRYGRLIDASRLACDYVWAMMSIGGEYFGLRNSVHSTKPALCFPVQAIDLLLHGLEANATTGSGPDAEEYAECLRNVREVVDRYVDTVERVSANRVEYGGRSSGTTSVESTGNATFAQRIY